MAKPRPPKKSLDSYTIKGTHKTIKAGDCVLMRASHPSKPPYVAKIEKIESGGRGGSVQVRVRWYYRPEESIGGRRQFHGSKEVFLSDHYDVQSADTIEGKCTVHSFKSYTKLDAVGNDDFFCRFEYNSTTGSFNPDRVAVYCKCEMPYNPDDLMIQCEACNDWFHPPCINMAVEEAKKLEHFYCQSCASDNGNMTLKAQTTHPEFKVICQDALKTQFPEFDLCVANIPYGISSPLIAKLLFGGYSFRNATLLLQKEFARRLLANPGDSEFNRLAVNVKLVASVEFVMDVSKRDFVPCPKVDSSVVKITPKAKIPDVSLDEWRAFTRTCFNKKNKTLGAIFKQKRKVLELSRLMCHEMKVKQENGNEDENDVEGEEDDDANDDDDADEDEEEGGDVIELGFLKEKIVGILKAGGFEGKRPCKISIEEMLHLLSLFNKAGIYFHSRQ